MAEGANTITLAIWHCNHACDNIGSFRGDWIFIRYSIEEVKQKCANVEVLTAIIQELCVLANTPKYVGKYTSVTEEKLNGIGNKNINIDTAKLLPFCNQ